jgi:heptosyltransferase-2
MKILLIRLGAIGDLVLASGVIRCIKKQLPEVELHVLVGAAYREVFRANPYIDVLHHMPIGEITLSHQLGEEAFDGIIDLQNDAHSRRLTKGINVPIYRAPNRLLQKKAFIHLKWNLMPREHQVDRYFEAVEPLGVTNDGAGLDYFIPKEEEISTRDLPASHQLGYVAITAGASAYTKQLPVELLQELCRKIEYPLILLGDQKDRARAAAAQNVDDVKIYNACGKFSLHESADILRRAKLVIAHDTGLMHMAAALQKAVIVVWGSTTPSLGMWPYYGEKRMGSAKLPFSSVQVHKLWCRPCTDIGRAACPLGHFKCMKKIPVDEIVRQVHERLGKG